MGSWTPSDAPGCRGDRRIEARAAVGEIPQLPDAYEIFGELRGVALDPAVGGLLVCDLRLPGTPWFQSRPDMQARLRLGGGPERILNGHDNRDEVVVTAPLASLASGEAISVSVEDRDLFNKNDYIDGATGSYEGIFPLILTGTAKKLHVLCQHVPAAAVAAQLPPLRAALGTSVAAYEAATQTTDQSAEDWGFPWSRRVQAELDLEAVVARIGWGDARVTPLRHRLQAVATGWAALAGPEVAAAAASATPAGSPRVAPGGQVTVTVGARGCGSTARSMVLAAGGLEEQVPRCVLELHLEATAAAVPFPVAMDGLTLTLPGGAAPELVNAAGWTQGLVAIPVPAAPATLAPGTPTTILVREDSLCWWGGREPVEDAVVLRLTAAAPAWMALP